MTARLHLLGTATLVLAALVGRAEAQSTGDAEKLFRDGKQLMKAGKRVEACEAFDASQRIESNVATLLSLADCREKNGQIASAWGHFLKAESLTRNDPAAAKLNALARQRSAALEPRLSFLIINVPDESRVDGLVVTRDGVLIDHGTWNRALPIDGGEHVISGKAPGHEPWTTTVTVAVESDRRSVDVPKFKEIPGVTDRAVTRVDAPAPMPAAAAPSRFTTRRKIAVGAAGASLVAIGAGVVLGVQAGSLDDDAVAACPAAGCTPSDARAANALRERARGRALGANVAFGVGAASAIAAGVLWYLGAPVEAEPAPGALSVRPHVGDFTGVTLDTRF